MTDLSDQMRALAKNNPRAAELEAAAAKFDEATAGFYANPQTVDVKRFVGSWARARRLYCDVTGESLI